MLGEVTTGMRVEARSSRSRWGPVCPVVPVTSGVPARAQASAMSAEASGVVKSTTTWGRSSRSAELKSSWTATRRGATPASVPASCPLTREPGRPTAPTTRTSGFSEAARTTARPIRPGTPVTRTETATRSAQQPETAELGGQRGAVRLPERHQGQPDVRPEEAEQVEGPLHRNGVGLGEEQPVERVELHLQIRRLLPLASQRGRDQVGHQPGGDVGGDGDDALSPAGDEGEHGEIVAGEQGEPGATLLPQLHGAGHVPGGLLHRGDLLQ